LGHIQAAGYSTIKEIDACAYGYTPEDTNKDVAWEVDTKVNACPAVDERPYYKHD
jgi:hypothetical protein